MPTSVAVIRADGMTVCERCRLADRPWSRMRGLLGRSSLAVGEGVLLRPAASIHTFFMRFTIDVVFLDRDGVVLSLRPGIRPWQTVWHRGASAVLELRAGDIDRTQLRVGDVLELASATARPHVLSPRET